jgi:uncharacterized C2H2 Zn-finger protein
MISRGFLQGSRGKEICPHCRACFKDVNDLIDHVTAFHDGNEGVPVSSGSNERCPECGVTFDDPVKLVQHVQSHRYEQQRTATRSAECAIS